VAGVDDGRFHWTPTPPWGVPIGYILLLVGYTGTGWTQAVNRYFEPSVRSQSDRGHSVMASGSYAYIRRPGRIFGIVLTFGVALTLGSLWALLPALSVAVVLAIRTFLEDATLKHELAGYGEYALRTRYKWIPGNLVTHPGLACRRSGRRVLMRRLTTVVAIGLPTRWRAIVPLAGATRNLSQSQKRRGRAGIHVTVTRGQQATADRLNRRHPTGSM
jgi:protein-S-isoprenylcysteine O-methyltransferase Ste14